MGNAPPAFQFYAERFVAGTDSFTVAEVGGYILLLCYQWRYGFVPGDNPKRLAPIMHCTASTANAIWQSIGRKFVKDDDGLWRNHRLEEARADTERFIARQKANGSLGGRPPKEKPQETQTQTQEKPTGSKRVPKSATFKNPLKTPQTSDLSTSLTELQNNSVNERPPRDLLAVHDRLFQERFEQKPPKYGAKEASIAKHLIHDYGFEKASALVQALFDSRDQWIQSKGYAFSLLASSTTQTELIAAMSGRLSHQDGLDGLREFVRG